MTHKASVALITKCHFNLTSLIMTTRLDTLPEDVVDHIYHHVHRGHVKAVCQELSVITEGLYGDPLFVSLSYEGFRPFDPCMSGARDVAVYMGECWQPYLCCTCCDGWITSIEDHWSDSGYSSSSGDYDNWSAPETD